MIDPLYEFYSDCYPIKGKRYKITVSRDEILRYYEGPFLKQQYMPGIGPIWTFDLGTHESDIFVQDIVEMEDCLST